MKTKTILFLVALTGAAAVALVNLKSFLPVKMRHELEHCFADAHTLAAAVSYLAMPDLPALPLRSAEWEIAKTNLPEVAQPAGRLLPDSTNFTRAVISNGIVTTQTDMKVAG